MTTTEPTTQAPGTAVAKRDAGTAAALIEQYTQDFANVLPSHIKPATWVRVAQGALKKGKRVALMRDGSIVRDRNNQPVQVFELEQAALNNPASFLSALLDAARQGLEPGTEQYYLTPRKTKGGGLSILGMRGYQGEIELIYRAGASATVIAEVVYTADKFEWVPGSLDVHQPPRWNGPQERPYHVRDWDLEERGELRLTYAYAVMNSGATSKVVVLNKADIKRIKSFAQGTETADSPWNTSEAAMWLKSAVHQLQKWVPTSPEYMTVQVRAQREGSTPEAIAAPAPLRMQADMPDIDPNLNGDNIFDNVYDADVVDESGDPSDPGPGDDGQTDYHEAVATESVPEPISKVQSAKLHAVLNGFGVRDRDRKLQVVSQLAGRALESSDHLTKAEAGTLIDTLEGIGGREQFDAIFALAPAE